jgi:mono/diheme cytochrome c family protein
MGFQLDYWNPILITTLSANLIIALNLKAMLKTCSLFLLIIFLSVYACGPTTERELPDRPVEVLPLSAGEALYKIHCVLCHGNDGKLGLNDAGDLSVSDLSLEERKGIIRDGKGVMIAYRRILSPAEIDAVARYTLEFNEINEDEIPE